MFPSHLFKTAFAACAVAILPQSLFALEQARIVFQNGRTVPLAAVDLTGDQFVVKTATDTYNLGQTFAFAMADHVYGDKPPALNQGIALIMLEQERDALKLLEPLLVEHRVSAKIPGNFWLEAARAALVAYAMAGNTAKMTELGKEIADATPAAGADQFTNLGKALGQSKVGKAEARDQALADLTTDNMPADVAAYACYFRAKIMQDNKKPDEALELYLSVPCVFPTGGMVVNGAAELQAAEILASMTGRREEAVALLTSAVRHSAGTAIFTEANKRLESLK